ncbi:hypothetical protein MVEN_00284500 [Mycena venus]|uniref:DUF6534 domain-containing protein n=1 Tax=Mycena venus TaxID=2733690 RepID=A0A8H6Z467_9AGAR|nr:hypothetical protein MVEN_00284500 [Mycena venus]
MDPVASFNPNTSLGGLQIGVLVSYVLFGVTTTQTYIYYSRFPQDSRKIKALVALVWICEAAHVISVGDGLYDYTITNYGNPERLGGAMPKSLFASLLFGGVIAVSVQGFFTWRTYTFSNKLFIPLLISAMILVRMIGSTVLAVMGFRMTLLAPFEKQWGSLFTALFIISAIIDLTITVTLVVFLRNRRNVAHERTMALIDKLIKWTIETALLTSAASMVTLACFITMKQNLIWVATFLVTTRLFSNSFLASLNSRQTLREMDQATRPTGPSLASAFGPSTSTNIQMTKVTQITYDTEPHGGIDSKVVSVEV